jgi:diguanylate cyclase (GGDEF)-like protein
VKGAALPRILVAADQATQLLVSQALKDEFEVVPAGAGLDAVEKAGAGDIDCILLDLKLRGLDGFDVCRRVKTEPQSGSIPVLFLTNINDRADESRGFDAGAADYITQPIKPSIVKARVRAHVELKRLRDRLEQLSFVDPLTGLANRTRFDAALETEWRRMGRAGRWLSIAIVDVDLFKRFNDRLGRPAGDERLHAIAGSLARAARRAGDLVARYGPDEFGVILPEIDPPMMQRMMRVLMVGVVSDAPRADAGQAADELTASVGAVSVVPARDKTIAGALAAVDRLLNEAKRAGRDRGVHLDLSSLAKIVIHRASPPDPSQTSS